MVYTLALRSVAYLDVWSVRCSSAYFVRHRHALYVRVSQIISVMPNKEDKRGFWYGSVSGQTGWFQNDFVEKVEVYYEAIHPYAADPTKTHLLSFQKGCVVLAIKDGDEGGWWQGELNGKSGLFYRPYFKKVVCTPATTAAAHSVPATPSSASGAAPAAGSATSSAVSSTSTGAPPPLLKAESAQRNFYRMMSFVNLDKVAASALTAGGMAGSPLPQRSTTATAAPGTTTRTAPCAVADATAQQSQPPEEEEEEEEAEEENVEHATEWVRAIHNYTGKPNTPEINLQRGDLLRVVQRFGSGWMEVCQVNAWW
jgi:Variant SH3 domain